MKTQRSVKFITYKDLAVGAFFVANYNGATRFGIRGSRIGILFDPKTHYPDVRSDNDLKSLRAMEIPDAILMLAARPDKLDAVTLSVGDVAIDDSDGPNLVVGSPNGVALFNLKTGESRQVPAAVHYAVYLCWDIRDENNPGVTFVPPRQPAKA